MVVDIHIIMYLCIYKQAYNVYIYNYMHINFSYVKVIVVYISLYVRTDHIY